MMSAGTRLVAFVLHECNQGVPGVPPVYQLFLYQVVHRKHPPPLGFSCLPSMCTECTTGLALALVIDRGPWL